jgi:hypothetical protein
LSFLFCLGLVPTGFEWQFAYAWSTLLGRQDLRAGVNKSENWVTLLDRAQANLRKR